MTKSKKSEVVISFLKGEETRTYPTLQVALPHYLSGPLAWPLAFQTPELESAGQYLLVGFQPATDPDTHDYEDQLGIKVERA